MHACTALKAQMEADSDGEISKYGVDMDEGNEQAFYPYYDEWNDQTSFPYH